jgi:type IV secretion system protein VirD4
MRPGDVGTGEALARALVSVGRAGATARTADPDRAEFVLFGFVLLVATASGTQYVAWRLGFSSTLGVRFMPGRPLAEGLWIVAVLSALAAIVATVRRRDWWVCGMAFFLSLSAWLASGGAGPLYPPHQIFVWYGRFGHVSSVFGPAWGVVVSVALFGGVVVSRAWRVLGPGHSEAHGSAQWGDARELKGDRGFLVGRDGRMLRFKGEGHLLTVAPTRSGKGVSAVIPNLLDHPGSIVVTDPKGENYAVTSRWRRDLGHTVVALDPFEQVEGDGCYNPLDLIDPERPDAVDDARLLADMLVVPEVREEPFWSEEARGLLTGLILHVATAVPQEIRTLALVRELLTLPPAGFAGLLSEMQQNQASCGLVARAAARLLQKADKERSGVISTAQSHTHFLDSPHMSRVLGASTIDLSALKTDRLSLYLILPTERLDGYARWLRLMIASALVGVTRARGRSRQRVLFLLDEFAHLGRLRPVQQGIGLAGGFGVTFWLIVQDFSQLKTAYGEAWPTFLANVDVLQAFGVNDWETAEHLSKLTGEATIVVESHSRSRGEGRSALEGGHRGAAWTRSEIGRRLLLPDEVRRLPRTTELLFVRGRAPLCRARVNYLSDPEFRGRAERNPLYDMTEAVSA